MECHSSDNITNDARISTDTPETGAKVEYSTDGTTWASSYTAPTTDGAYLVYVRQTDKAGNVSTPYSFRYTYDKTAPVLADNGHGIPQWDNDTQQQVRRSPTSMGLLGLQKRMAQRHGHCRIDSCASGTQVHLVVPV